RDAAVIAGFREIRIEKTVSERAAPAMLEIHDGERDLAHHVDPAHPFVEFDAVEKRERAVDERNVAEMQIAMAFAHEPFCQSAREGRAVRGMFATRPCF